VFASAALVGAIREEHFTGIEGSQGPYKLRDKWQLYVLVISGSERVYVNGLLLRGENNDYTIDYNAGEITFLLFTISSKCSAIEYQYSDRNYTRL
jgi:hypothetical protein